MEILEILKSNNMPDNKDVLMDALCSIMFDYITLIKEYKLCRLFVR